MQLKRQIIRTTVIWVALSGLLFFVNPSNIPVVLLVVPFIMIYFAFYELWLLLSLLWQKFAQRKANQDADSRQTAKLLSLFISFIAILGSLGQLVARDVITLFLLFVIGYFYLLRGRKRNRTN